MGQVYWLEEFSRCCGTELGTLAVGLGQLDQRGLPLRPTWVVSTTVFELVLAQALANIDEEMAVLAESSPSHFCDNPQQLQGLARHLQAQMLAIPFPQAAKAEIAIAIAQAGACEWRLQPSLVQPQGEDAAATTGLWDTLVVKSDLEEVVAAIQQLWAQSFTAQNLLLWLSQDGQLQDLKLAVLVQDLGIVQQSGFLQVDALGLQVESVWGESGVIAKGDVLPTRQSWTWEGTILSHEEGYQPLLSASPSWLLAFHPLPESLEADLPRGSMGKHSILQMYGLNPVLHPRSALTAGLLSDLQHLGQQLWTELQTPAWVEWVYAAPHQLGIVGFQTLPCSKTLQRASQLVTVSDPAPIVQSETISLLAEEPIDPAELESGRLLTGVPASPGHAWGLAWVVKEAELIPDWIPAGTILVTPILNPLGLPVLQQVAGIVTEQGGLTSHGAILARELGVPAVVAIATATQKIRTGDLIGLDGTRGEVKIGNWRPSTSSHPFQPKLAIVLAPVTPPPPAPPVPLPPTVEERDTRTQLWVNLSQLSSLAKVQNVPIAGVGLLRAEFMALDLLEQQHPLQWLQDGRGKLLEAKLSERIQQFLHNVQPRPVFYRFLDLHSREFQALKGYPNPAMQVGADLRGTLSHPYFPMLLQLELAALRQVQRAGYQNLNVLLPFVRSVSEVEFCRAQIQEAGLLESGTLQVWMMAEVPAVLFQLAEYQQAGIQGISIGTNDLTRLLLGIAREQPPTRGLDARHPAVKRAIAALIRQSRDLGLPCTICGDAPALYPELIEALVEWGINGISVSVAALEATHQAIQRAEQRLFL